MFNPMDDTTNILAKTLQCLNNVGDDGLSVFRAYASYDIARALTESGQMVQQLSHGDRVTKQ